MHTIRCILFSLTALCVIDGHQFVGQSIAWIAMLGDRAPRMGIQEALQDTFSGESPCAVCRAISAERQKRREETPVPEARPELKFAPVVFSTPVVLPSPPTSTGASPAPTTSVLRSWAADVPTPPPRVA